DGADASKVDIHADGQTLQLRQIGGQLPGSHRLSAVVHVTTPTLTAINSSRGVEFWGDHLSADRLAIRGAMGTEMHLAGTCGALTINASMGAEIDASHLDCASAEAEASMGGEIRVHAHESAIARASMGGEVRVSGNPAKRDHSAGLG